MILKTCFLLVVSVAWEVSGDSFSTVFVQNGPEAAPKKYITYGATPYNYEYPTAQRAQYNVAPVSYEYPIAETYSYRTACPSGACIYPEQTIAAIAPATSAANYLTYNAPAVSNLPYVYGASEPASSYSYVLVNQGAAGQNLKLSDGEVIRGGYTFLQPEGLVQYVAEENQGLNAIFRSNIPIDAVAHTETAHETVNQKSVHHAEPCHEALTEHESSDVDVEHHGEHEHPKTHEENHEARHGGHKEPEVHEFVLQGDSESGHHDRIIVIEAQERHYEEPEEPQATEHEGHDHREPEHEIHHEPDHEEHGHHDTEIVVLENHHIIHESHDHDAPKHEGHEEPTHEAIVEMVHKPQENNENHEGPVVPQVPALVGNNAYIPYNDFIKCIQAAMAKGVTYPYYTGVPKPTSPLTYLVFNKPC